MTIVLISVALIVVVAVISAILDGRERRHLELLDELRRK